MRRDGPEAELGGVLLDDVPHQAFGHAVTPALSGSADAPEQFARFEFGGPDPCVDGRLKASHVSRQLDRALPEISAARVIAVGDHGCTAQFPRTPSKGILHRRETGGTVCQCCRQSDTYAVPL
jgi:hypothetical protein